MTLEQIQKFLGHAKLETTQIYAESTTEMIKESYRRAMARETSVDRLPIASSASPTPARAGGWWSPPIGAHPPPHGSAGQRRADA
jgi:hypothetical protein